MPHSVASPDFPLSVSLRAGSPELVRPVLRTLSGGDSSARTVRQTAGLYQRHPPSSRSAFARCDILPDRGPPLLLRPTRAESAQGGSHVSDDEETTAAELEIRTLLCSPATTRCPTTPVPRSQRCAPPTGNGSPPPARWILPAYSCADALRLCAPQGAYTATAGATSYILCDSNSVANAGATICSVRDLLSPRSKYAIRLLWAAPACLALPPSVLSSAPCDNAFLLPRGVRRTLLRTATQRARAALATRAASLVRFN